MLPLSSIFFWWDFTDQSYTLLWLWTMSVWKIILSECCLCMVLALHTEHLLSAVCFHLKRILVLVCLNRISQFIPCWLFLNVPNWLSQLLQRKLLLSQPGFEVKFEVTRFSCNMNTMKLCWKLRISQCGEPLLLFFHCKVVVPVCAVCE